MSVDKLPDEILQQILFSVSASDTYLSAQLVCKRWWRLCADPELWKHHCLSVFKHWHPDHGLRGKIKQAPSAVEWRDMFVARWKRHREASALFESVIGTEYCRFPKIRRLVDMGYDVKDLLLQESRCPDSAQDVLARRYWASSLLRSMHRRIAVDQWSDIGQRLLRSNPPERRIDDLERALAAFDMFLLVDGPIDLRNTQDKLDELACQFTATQDQWHEKSLREKALALSMWLRLNNYVGIANIQRDYHNLRNCFLGQALLGENHESLPLISSAIFCCVGRRVGIPADCCATPGHVYAIVTAEDGIDLNGRRQHVSNTPRDRMYLDPFANDLEISLQDIQDRLSILGWNFSNTSLYGPTEPTEMALRLARNIERSVGFRVDGTPEQIRAREEMYERNRSAANAAIWVSIMMATPLTVEWSANLRTLLHFPRALCEDEHLAHTFLSRVGHESRSSRLTMNYMPTWREAVRHDELRPTAARRLTPDDFGRPFKIGQVIRHRRYGWIGLICGWLRPYPPGVDGNPDETAGMARTRPFFFTCLRSHREETHDLISDSMEIINDLDVIEGAEFPAAGKYFKRFDRERRVFVSNMPLAFPND